MNKYEQLVIELCAKVWISDLVDFINKQLDKNIKQIVITPKIENNEMIANKVDIKFY